MRLLIVTGLPGTGKTTLARQLAARSGIAARALLAAIDEWWHPRTG